jgi:iron complex outermembrane receptor protein
MKKQFRLGLVAALAASGALAQQTEETQQVERVLITAERRVATLDTTPAAVTALAGRQLAEQGQSGLADITALSPNTSFTTGQGAAQLFIRGIGNVFILAGGDPGVALYSDGAYVSDQTSSNLGLFDTERVELLRGPQGALYGRNATGGAVNMISAAPSATFKAQADLVLGNHGRRDSEGFITGGLGSDALRGRLSYQVKRLDGYTRNPLPGGPARLDDLDSRAVRGQLAADVGNGGQLRFIASTQRERDNGPSMAVLEDPVMVSTLLYGATPERDPRVVKSQAAHNRVDLDTAQVLLDLPLGKQTLSVNASWRRSAVDRFWDADATEGDVATSDFKTSSTDRSIDVHLSSDEDAPLQWIAGLTHLAFNQRQDVAINTQVPLGFIVPGAPMTVAMPGGVNFLVGGQVRTRSTAAYLDLRYRLAPGWTLLAGLRHNRDKKNADEYQDTAAFGLSGTASPHDAWSSTPGSLGVEWQPDKESLAYAKVSRGFKSGAVNLGALQPQLVKPETVTGIELGYKTSFLERRGVFSAALFSNDYQDMQVSQVGEATVLLTNASKAKIDGLELETAVRAAQDLTLTAGLGLMRPRYTAFVNTDLRNSPTAPSDVSGNQLAQVSKAQAMFVAEYTPRIQGYKTSLRAEYVWRDRVYFTEFNTPDAMQDGYGLLNLSASIGAPDSRWKLFTFVRNATNKTALTSMSIASPLLAAARQVTYTPPRMFGLGASVQF